MRLHLCCGGVYLEGFLNIDKFPYEEGDDSRSGCVADLMADVFDLPFESSSVNEIVMCHGLEHFYRFEGEKLLESFSELLNDTGVLYLEMPSRNRVFLLCFWERFIATLLLRRRKLPFGRGLATSAIWGNQWSGFDYEAHKYLWTSSELQKSAKQFGLNYCSHFTFTSSHIPFRDMGIAFGKDADVVGRYQPPSIARQGRSGIFMSCAAFFASLYLVAKTVVRS